MTMFGYNVLGFGAGGAPGPYEISYLSVAGGGGGGNNIGSGTYASAGGGGGGLLTATNLELVIGTLYTITVGAGGAIANDSSGKGTNSTIDKVMLVELIKVQQQELLEVVVVLEEQEVMLLVVLEQFQHLLIALFQQHKTQM